MGVGEDSGVSLNHDQAVAALVPASYFLLLTFSFFHFFIISGMWLQPYFSQPFTSRLSCLICSAPDGDTTVLGGRAVGELLRAAPRGVGGGGDLADSRDTGALCQRHDFIHIFISFCPGDPLHPGGVEAVRSGPGVCMPVVMWQVLSLLLLSLYIQSEVVVEIYMLCGVVVALDGCLPV